MVVTADPLGDYNATSQILRYSALAREVTVPRIPSLTSTLPPLPRPATSASGRATPTMHQQATADLEEALREISLLREDLALTQLRLEEETTRRINAETSWLNKIETLEADLREEIWDEMEEQLTVERRRFQAARTAELESNEVHLDKKLEILSRGLEEVRVHEDEEGVEERLELLEDENKALREKLERLEWEKENNKSPVRKMRVLKPRKWEGGNEFGVGVLGSP